jgi:hypothetical protein
VGSRDGVSVNEEEQRVEITRITYEYLRWLLIVPSLLFVVTTLTAWQQGELERSISAYYGGPVRDIFVGAPFAIAACLVAYQGVGLLEDYALNGGVLCAVRRAGTDGVRGADERTAAEPDSGRGRAGGQCLVPQDRAHVRASRHTDDSPTAAI